MENLTEKFDKVSSNSLLDEDPDKTPKKRTYFPQQSHSKQDRVKFKYTIIEKPSHSWTHTLIIVVWLSIFATSFWLSYQSKILNLEKEISLERNQCQTDYFTNKYLFAQSRCEAPVKGIKEYCAKKKNCMDSDIQQTVKLRTKGALFLGEVVREFLDGLGLAVIGIGLLYLWLSSCSRKEVRKQFVEYHP